MPTPNSASAAALEQDSFRNFYGATKREGKAPKLPNAYHLRGKRLPYDQLQFFEGHLSAKEVLARAHELGVSLTSYLGASLMLAIYAEMPALERSKPIAISLPVNLRNYYPSETARNFFNSVYVILTLTETDTMQTAAAAFDAQLKEALLPENIKAQMDEYEKLEHIPGIRPVPLVVKNLTVKFFTALEKKHVTAVISNMGRVTLPDGSGVWLNADSRLAYSDRFTASGSRAVRLEGEAFFDVKRDTLRPFEVEMGKLRVKVLGTRFTASHRPAFNPEGVTLLSVKVEVSGYRADQSVVLTPDQSCSYDAGSGAVAVRNVAASNYCSWTGNSIIFDNMTLADIAVNLEHWYNIRFRIDERIDTSIRISFTLRPETLEETLKIIETLTHLRCRQIDKHYVIIHK